MKWQRWIFPTKFLFSNLRRVENLIFSQIGTCLNKCGWAPGGVASRRATTSWKTVDGQNPANILRCCNYENMQNVALDFLNKVLFFKISIHSISRPFQWEMKEINRLQRPRVAARRPTTSPPTRSDGILLNYSPSRIQIHFK